MTELKSILDKHKEIYNAENKNQSSSDRIYSKFVMENDDNDDWFKWIGKALITGIYCDVETEIIHETIFEAYHGFGLSELPETIEQFIDDWNETKKCYPKE